MHLNENPATRRLRLALLASALAITGCTAGDAEEPAASPGSVTGSERPTEPTEATATPAPLPSTSSATESEEDATVLAAYTRYLDSTVLAMETGDPAQIEGARGQALAAAQGRVTALTSQDRTARGAFVPDVQVLEVDGETAELNDCYRADVTEHDRDSGDEVADRAGLRFGATAKLEHDEDGWVVVEFSQGDHCVPEELARALESRYVAFWDAVGAAGRPPDPDYADLADTAGGGQLAGLQARLAEFRDEGHEVRDESVPHPVAVQVSHDDTVGIVRDCRDLDPDGGVYDAESGELVEGGAEEGQRALWETRLELIDGVWKVVDADLAEEDSACDPAAS